MQKTKGENIELRAALNEELSERFLVVKEHTGMNSNKNVLAFLISNEYDKIQASRHRKLFVRNEMYDILEKKAAARGQSVDIYVQELIDDEIRKSEESGKHAENSN